MVDRQGAATNLLRYYTAAHSVRTADDVESRQQLPDRGKSVRLARQTGSSVRLSSGSLSEMDRSELSDAIKANRDQLYPITLIAGDTWTPHSPVVGLSADLEVTSSRVKLIEVVMFAGRRCAHVHLTFESTKHSAKETMETKLEGDAFFAWISSEPLPLASARFCHGFRSREVSGLGPHTQH